MKITWSRIAAVCCAVALVAVPVSVSAQAKQAQPPKPAAKEWEESLAGWNDIGRKLIAMAEDMPEAKYWYQPTKDVRTFGDMLLHVAGVNYELVNAAAGKQLGKAENDPPRAQYPNKAAVVAYLKKSFEDGAGLMKNVKSHEEFEKPVKYPWGNQMIHPHSLWSVAIAHASEHYGSLVTYYRIQGMVPPESRPRR